MRCWQVWPTSVAAEENAAIAVIHDHGCMAAKAAGGLVLPHRNPA
jgi:hypothetical protein